MAKANIASQKTDCVKVICNGSPSRIRIVLLISLGMTTLPRSSILLTIPVAFIYRYPFITILRKLFASLAILSAGYPDLYRHEMTFANIVPDAAQYYGTALSFKNVVSFRAVHSYPVFSSVYADIFFICAEAPVKFR